MKPIKVAINGFGRIGRSFFRLAIERDDLEVVAVNDLGSLENLVYLLKYDTAQGLAHFDVEIDEDQKGFIANGKHVAFVQQRNPAELPWGQMGIDIVVESTGFFTRFADAKMHLDAGARRVVISAPGKGEPVPGIESQTVLMGVNDGALGVCKITSNGSCTTNASSPVVQILSETIGVEKAMLTTVHGYTTSQSLVDSPNKKNVRMGRSAAQNIVPTTTGAAIALAKAIPSLNGKFDGMAMRVPVVAGSVADITFVASRQTSVEEVNQILAEAAQTDRWNKVFTTTTEPIVSSDIVGSTFASIADLSFTKVIAGDLVKVLAWYDNETGYTSALVEHVAAMGARIQ